MEALVGEAAVQHQFLDLVRAHRLTTTSPLAHAPSFPSFSLSSSSRLVVDMDGGIKPLSPLTLYDFYFQPNEVEKFSYAYILILDDESKFIPLSSLSPNSRSSLDTFYQFVSDRYGGDQPLQFSKDNLIKIKLATLDV